MYKTLLGIYKYKDILPWHGCFEFITNDKDYYYIENNFEKYLNKLNLDLSYTKMGIQIYNKNKKWPYISIRKYNSHLKDHIFQEGELFPTCKYKFNDILLNIPNNTDNILNNLYGNWKSNCISSDYDYKKQKLYYKIFTIKWTELNQNTFSTENTWMINLDRSRNRWNKSKNRLKKIGIIPKRWKATDKNSEEVKVMYKNIKGFKNMTNTGTLACYLSHKKLWEYLYDIGVPYAIIFEDDIIYEDNVSLKDICKIFKNSIGFNIIFLGYTSPNRPIFTNQYVTEGGGTCLHSYIISRKGLENLLKLKHDFVHPVDKVVKDFSEDNLCYISKHIKNNNFGCGIIQQDININSDLRFRFSVFGNIISL